MPKGKHRCKSVLYSYLLTTMGMGRVRMKMPQRAQRPPISLPGNVEGESSP